MKRKVTSWRVAAQKIGRRRVWGEGGGGEGRKDMRMW